MTYRSPVRSTLIKNLFNREGQQVPSRSEPQDQAPSATTGRETLAALLSVIEGVALDLYGKHGLPQVPGHYRRADEDQAWELMGTHLTSEERFDLILEGTQDKRLRYAALPNIGADHPSLEVRQASALLAACRGIAYRMESQGALAPQDLVDAMRMGSLYQNLKDGAQQGLDMPDLQTLTLLDEVFGQAGETAD